MRLYILKLLSNLKPFNCNILVTKKRLGGRFTMPMRLGSLLNSVFDSKHSEDKGSPAPVIPKNEES